MKSEFTVTFDSLGEAIVYASVSLGMVWNGLE